MTYRHIFFLAWAMFLYGCAGMSQNLRQTAGESYEFSPGTQEGLVVLSTRFSPDGCTADVKGSGATLSVRPERGGVPDTLFLKSPMLTPDFEKPIGQVFIRKLRAGTYYFDRLGYAWGYLPGQGFDSDRSLDIPFTVKAGEVHYLGEITVTMHSCTSFDIKIKDQRTRDLELFAKRMKKIPAHSVKNQILLQGMKPVTN